MIEHVLEYWIEYLFGLITIGFGLVYKRLSKRIKSMKKENDALKNGIRALLHNQIISEGKKLVIKKYCTPEEYEDMEYLWSSYHELNGNGSAERMINQVRALPQTPPAE